MKVTHQGTKSLIWKVMAQFHTEKRIILAGTLFQNSFEELYNIMYLVRRNDAMLLEKDESRDWLL
jgi:DNA repair and recombination protein RAD54 and RAD54-like protein